MLTSLNVVNRALNNWAQDDAIRSNATPLDEILLHFIVTLPSAQAFINSSTEQKGHM